MKELFVGLFIFIGISVYSQCARQFSKIVKYEEFFPKDAYGNPSSQRKLSCTLSDGSKSTLLIYDAYVNNDVEVLFNGTNTSKTAYIIITNNQYRIDIKGFYFYKFSYDKRFSDAPMKWDPTIDNIIGTRPEYDGFDPKDGWAFSRVEGDLVIMVKNGKEYKFSTNNKTNEKYCDLYFKLQQ